MSKTMRIVSLAVLLTSFGAVAFADSHEPTVYVWVNFMKAKPGQGDALIGLLMEEDAKLFDPLVESGKALEWGIAMPVVHDGDDAATHIEWITFVGWEGADQFMSDFMAKRQTLTEEDMAAISAKWSAVVEPGSHSDMINRSVVVGSPNPVRPGYIHLGYWKAQRGKGAEAKAAFDEIAAPVYSQLMADGAIQNYGLHVPAVHRNRGWTHMGWYMSESLAARDAVSNGFDAADAARSEEEQKAVMSRMIETFEPGHVDQILLVVHHKTASGDGD